MRKDVSPSFLIITLYILLSLCLHITVPYHYNDCPVLWAMTKQPQLLSFGQWLAIVMGRHTSGIFVPWISSMGSVKVGIQDVFALNRLPVVFLEFMVADVDRIKALRHFEMHLRKGLNNYYLIWLTHHTFKQAACKDFFFFVLSWNTRSYNKKVYAKY